MKNKWAAIYQYYIDCPSCQGTGGIPHLKLFSSIKELIQYAWDKYGEGEIEQVYSLKTGRSMEDKIDFYYEVGQHRVKGMSIKIKNKTYKTFDNGSGKLLLQDTETTRTLFGAKNEKIRSNG